MDTDEKPSSKLSPPKFVWATLCAVLLIVVVSTVNSGKSLSELDFLGIFKAKFEKGMADSDKLDKLGDEKLKKNQAELEDTLREMKAKVKKVSAVEDSFADDPDDSDSSEDEMEDAVQDEPHVTNISISGSWHGQDGMAYMINQNAGYITIQEISPIYGITAVGAGTVSGKVVDVSYQTAVGTSGNSRLELSEDGQELTGSYKDFNTGMSGQLKLTKG